MSNAAVSTVGRALRHWHWLIWLSVALAVALALGATFVRPPVYEATTVLSIDESQAAGQGFDVAMQADQFLAQRFISLAASRDVLQAVCTREGPGCSPTTLAKQVRVTTPRTTAQLEVVATASSPEAASRLANETADALIARNRALVNEQVQGQRALLQGQLRDIGNQVTQTLQETGGSVGSSDAASLAQLSFLQTQYSATYQRLQDLDVQAAQRENVLTVQQRAVPPLAPADPNPVRYLLVGVAGGLVAGLLAALVAERLRRRIRHASELAEAAGTNVVADLTRGRRGGGSAGQYGFLARLGRVGPPDRPRSMLLVASTERDHVNDVAMELAEVVAANHERVLVVPAPQAAGDSGRAPVVVTRDDRSAERPEPANEIDVAIHCSLPPMQDATVERLRPAPDRAIVVATSGRTTFDEARRTAGLLRAVGVEVAAAVLLPARMAPRPVPARPRRAVAEVAAD